MVEERRDSAAEHWKTEKEEFAAALAADAELARKDREARKQYQLEHREPRWARLVMIAVLAVFILLFVERQNMEQRAAACFNVARPDSRSCADAVAGSFWTWLLPSEMKRELRAAQLALHAKSEPAKSEQGSPPARDGGPP